MSENIYQVFQANPITTNDSGDLMYFGQSPYGVNNDAAMTFQNFKAQFLTPDTGVSSVTGTQFQVLVNGSYGSAQVGALTLTLPQNIATTNSPTFASLTLSSPLTVANGGTGHATFTAYTLLAGGTTTTGNVQQVSAGSSGQILQSNGAGALASWVNLSSVGVASITGTANQVLANATSATPQTGAVTLTLPQDIATSSTPTFTGLNVGNLNLATNVISATNTNGNISLDPNGTGQVAVGSSTVFPLGSSKGLAVYSIAGNALMDVFCFSPSTSNSAQIGLARSPSGAVNSFVAQSVDDPIGKIFMFGSDATQIVTSGSIECYVDNTVSAGVVPARLEFYTANASGVHTLGLTINSSQNAIFAANVSAGKDASAGHFTSFPATTASGTLSVTAANSAGSFANVLTNLSTSSARTWSLPDATGTVALTSQIPTGSALTKADDTNVTLTLGGSPTTALVNAASLTLGWTGTLSGTRGGTGVNNGASTITLGGSLTTSGAFASTFTMTGATSVTFPTSGTLATTAGTVSSVSGTTNRITSTGGTTPAIDISASYVGQSSITTLGTITTGTWTGTTIAVANGGTGITSFGTGVATALGQNVTGSGGIALANGPTFVTSTVTAPSITFSTTSGVIGTTTNNSAAAGSVGEVLEVNNDGAPVNLTSGAAANVVSKTLGPGDYDVYGCGVIQKGTVLTLAQLALSTTSAVFPNILYRNILWPTVASLDYYGGAVPMLRVQVANATTTTVYLVAFATDSGTATAQGQIIARRRR